MIRAAKKGFWLLAAAGSVCAVSAFSFWLYARDLPSAGDEDLLVVREPIPGAENSFVLFDRAAKLVEWPDGENRERILEVLQNNAWDEALVRHLLERNREPLALFEAAIELPAYQAPVLLNASADRTEDFLLAQCVQLRSLHHSGHGRQVQAAEDAMNVADYGRRIMSCPANLTHFLIGATVRRLGLRRLRECLAGPSLSPAALRGYMARVRHPGKEGLLDAVRIEYMCGAVVLEELKAGETSLEAVRGVTGYGSMDDMPDEFQPPDPAPVVAALRSPYHFQLNRTKRLFAEAHRPYIDGYETFAEARAALDQHEKSMDRSRLRFGARRFRRYRRNGTGEILYAMFATTSCRGVYATWFQARVAASATRLASAVHLYRGEKGTLPPSLGALVPDQIEAVPTDAFDGKPMRYSRKTGIVYSVGPNLKENGGAEGKIGDTPPDLVFPVAPARRAGEPDDRLRRRGQRSE